MIIRKNPAIVVRMIHGSSFLINIQDNYSGDQCSLYEVNQTGLFIWNNLDGVKSINEIATLLKMAIIDDIDYQIILNDVSDFLQSLVTKRFAEVITNG